MIFKKVIAAFCFLFSVSAWANFYIDSEIGACYSSNSLPNQYSKFEEGSTISLAWSGSFGYGNSFIQAGIGNHANLFSDIKKSHVYLDTALWVTPSFALCVKPVLKSWYDDDSLPGFTKAKFRHGGIIGASYVFNPWIGISVNYESISYKAQDIQLNKDTVLKHKALFVGLYFPWTL